MSSTLKDRLEEIKAREELAQVSRSRMVGWLTYVLGVVGIGVGCVLYLITTIEYESNGSFLQEVMCRPYAMEAKIYWIIGGIVAVIGMVTGLFYGKKRQDILKKIEKRAEERKGIGY